MSEEKMEMFRNRLVKVSRHLDKQAKRQGITCYRLYDHDIPEFPFAIERYEGHVYVAEYKRNHGMDDDSHGAWITACMEVVCEVLGVTAAAVFVKLRQRKAGRLGQYQKLDRQAHEFTVSEAGLQFIVNLSDYLDTGLFLDHRTTRAMVRKESQGKSVLNLFAYTGSFSVYAAAGGAASVTTVDLSNTYLAWAKRNMELNGFSDPGVYNYLQVDVKQWLVEKQDETYDLIVMDPPTFSNSKRMDDFLDIQKDHVALINHCMRLLNPGGVLYFSTNLRTFVPDVEAITARSLNDITRATTPFDFAGKLFRWCYRLER